MSFSYQEIKNKLQQKDDAFADQVSYFKNISEASSLQFLQKEKLEELKNISNIHEFIWQFYEFYNYNAFTFSEEVRNAYNDLLNKSNPYKWNISIHDIVKQIQSINSRGVIFIPVNAGVVSSILTTQVNIVSYFHGEFISIIANSGKFNSNSDFDFDFRRQLQNIFRRRVYNKQGNKSEFDVKMNEPFNWINTILENNKSNLPVISTEKLAKKIVKGRMEDEYLKMLFESTLLTPNYKTIEKYIAFYPLLLLLLHDKTDGNFTLYTAEEFEQKGLTYTGDKVYYEDDYRKYQKSRVERILGL